MGLWPPRPPETGEPLAGAWLALLLPVLIALCFVCPQGSGWTWCAWGSSPSTRCPSSRSGIFPPWAALFSASAAASPARRAPPACPPPARPIRPVNARLTLCSSASTVPSSRGTPVPGEGSDVWGKGRALRGKPHPARTLAHSHVACLLPSVVCTLEPAKWRLSICAASGPTFHTGRTGRGMNSSGRRVLSPSCAGGSCSLFAAAQPLQPWRLPLG